MSILSFYDTNQEEEKKGKWIDILTNEDGSVCRLKIARANESRNFDYARLKYEVEEEIEEKYGDKEVPEEERRKYDCRVISEAILVDWENFQNHRNENIEYSTETAYDILIKYPNLYQDVVLFAKSNDFFKNKRLEENAGN